MHHLTIRIIIIELLTLVLTLLLINNPHDYTIFLFIKLFSYSFGAGYTSYILLKEFKYSPKKIHFNEVKNTFNDSKSFFLSRAFAVLHNEIAIILIGGYLTAKDIAYFDLARKVLSVFLIPNSIINTVAFPLLSKTKNIQLGKKIFLIRNILSIMLVAILLFGAPYFIAVLAPNPSPEVIQYVRLISILIFIRGVIYYTGISILVPFGYDSIFNKSVIYAVIIYLSLAYSLILLSIFSIITIISVMIVSEAFQAFYRYYYCKQHSLL